MTERQENRRRIKEESLEVPAAEPEGKDFWLALICANLTITRRAGLSFSCLMRLNLETLFKLIAKQ